MVVELRISASTPSTLLNLIVLPTLALRYGRFERDTSAETGATTSSG